MSIKENQNIKILLEWVILQIGENKFLLLEKLKILYHGLIKQKTFLMKKLLEQDMKNCKSQIKLSLYLKK